MALADQFIFDTRDINQTPGLPKNSQEEREWAEAEAARLRKGGTPLPPSTWGPGQEFLDFPREYVPESKETSPDTWADEWKFYGFTTEEQRRNVLNRWEAEHVTGSGPNAYWELPSGIVVNEGKLLAQVFNTNEDDQLKLKVMGGPLPAAAFKKPATPSGSSGAPSWYYQGLLDQGRGTLGRDLAKDYADAQRNARKDAGEIEIARGTLAEQLRNNQFTRNMSNYAASQKNTELGMRADEMMFTQQQAIANTELQIENLTQQRDWNIASANSAANNAAAQFNAQQGFAVQRANVEAEQTRTTQLQSLANTIAEAAKQPGDYGKLAALQLANTGWGAPNTAIGQGADLRTTQSLSPLESQLRTREDVMNRPVNPYTFTPYTPERAAPPALDFSRVKMPTVNAKVAAGLNFGDLPNPGAPYNPDSTPGYTVLPNGGIDLSAAESLAMNKAGMPWQPTPMNPDGTFIVPKAEYGGILPRYEEGGINQRPQQNIGGLANTGATTYPELIEWLVAGGVPRESLNGRAGAVEVVDTFRQSDEALARNTAALPMPGAGGAPPPKMLSAPPIFQDDAPNVDPWESTSAVPTAAPTATEQAPQGMAQEQFDQYKARKERFDADWGAMKSGAMSGEDHVERNADLDDDAFLHFSKTYGIPAAGSAMLAIGAGLPWFMKWLKAGNQYGYDVLPGTPPPSTPPPFPEPIKLLPGRRVVKPAMAGNAAYNPQPLRSVGLGAYANEMETMGYSHGGIANGAYISGERGPELNIPIGDKTIILNQKQMKAAGIDLKELMYGKPQQFAGGGIFDAGWGNVQDADRTRAMQFLNDATARARAGTPFATGALPTPVYASSPGFSPIVTDVLGSLTSMEQGIPAEYFKELAARYRPTGVRESPIGRSA